MFFKFNPYTVESVTNGHPDKICDQISDALLDACLKQDPFSRVAIEVIGSHGLIVVAGEITTKADFDPVKITKNIYRKIGYKDKVKIISHITKQSPDISQGVDKGGAGDQGIMYGFATNETKAYLPLGNILVHKLARSLQTLRESKQLNWLLPDGKTEVTIQNGKVKTVLISCQHKTSITYPKLVKAIINKLIEPIISHHNEYEIYVNPTGRFVQGGFAADSGLTGRKIMVDTYGGLIPHGGGCFSGKDPSKVDRSAAYMARYVAKNMVAQGYAKQCLVSVAYAIGKAEPLMLQAFDENGKKLTSLIKKKYDFRPQAIIERLNLRRPIYQKTATYGHFTNPEFPWEKID